MTEDEWLTRCGFHLLEFRPLYDRATGRQVVYLAVAWLRRFERYWAPIPSPSEVIAAIFHNSQMDRAINFLERWAGGRAGPLELGEATKDAREAAHFAQVLVEDLVEDNEERQMEWRAYVTEAAADAVESVCELIRLCRTPGQKLADALAPLGGRANPNLPPFVLEREGPSRRPRLGTPQQRLLDCLVGDLRGLSGAIAEAEVGLTSERYNAVIDAESRAEQPLLHDIFGNPFRPVAMDPAWRTEAALALARQMYESRDFSPMPILADALQDVGCEDGAILSHCRVGGPHVRGCWVADLIIGKQS
jgi:hypothetical protein